MAFLIDVLADAVIDTLKLIPFLFVTYLAMEYLERKTADHSTQLMEKAGKLGPVIGGVIGIIPQCGFSAAAASLYSGGVITLGSLVAVFLSTSDEMLPIFISQAAPVSSIIKILIVKMLIGIITGLGVDVFFQLFHRFRKTERHIHDLCEQEHCGCDEDEEEGIIKPALHHTLNITIFIFIITFIVALLVDLVGHDAMARFLTGRPVIGVVLAGLIGLIPNCAASVTLTQLWFEGILSAGQMIAGLLSCAGVGLLVLFRTNRHLKDNIRITVLIFVVSVLWGLVFEAAGFAL